MSHEPPEATVPTRTELLLTALLVTVFAGAVFGAFDGLYHGQGFGSQDVLVAMGLSASLAVGAGAPVLAVTVLLVRWQRPSLSRRAWMGVLCGLAIVLLVMAVVLVGTQGQRNLVGFLAILGAVPFAALVAARFIGAVGLNRPAMPALVLVSATLGVVLASGGLTTIGGMGPAGLMKAACVVIGVAGVIVPPLAGRRNPRGAVWATGIGLVLAVAAMAMREPLVASGRHPQVVEATQSNRPNVVLIVLDTTRRDHLGCYGGPEGLTPNLDALAREGVVYEQAFSTSTWTVPSHASLFTGLHPVTHGCSREHHLWLDRRFVTLAEMLASLGYQTAAWSSNSLLARTNQLQGFEHYESLDGWCDAVVSHRLSLFLGLPQRWVDKGGSEVHGAAARFFSQSRDASRPLFLFVNLLEAHSPYLAPFAPRRAQLPQDAGFLAASHLGLTFRPYHEWLAGTRRDEVEEALRALYRAEVAYQDEQFGRLIGWLSERLDWQNTLLIVTADHGENLGEGGHWGHDFTLDDVLVHVPLIVRYPRLFAPGTRLEGLCQLEDVVPTVFDVVGLPCPQKDLAGRTLVPERFEAREAVYVQMYPPVGRALGPMEWRDRKLFGLLPRLGAWRRAVRTPSFKFIWSSDGTTQLFDMEHDPKESLNLVQELPDVARDLNNRLHEWWKNQPTYTRPEVDTESVPSFEAADLQRLKALGYVD